MAINQDTIKNMPYFSGLSDAVLASVSRHFFEKKAVRGDILVFEGEAADALYFVVSGVVKVFKTSAEGKEQILRIIRPGDSFNDVPVLGGGMNLASAAAMSAAVLNGIKKKDLETVSKEHPQVALNIIKVLSRRVQEMVELVEDLSFRSVVNRMARLLLELAVVQGGTAPVPRLTQDEMAARVGSVRDVIGRALKGLEAAGAIRLEGHRIYVVDSEKLKKMA